jgi:hypothetical protein
MWTSQRAGLAGDRAARRDLREEKAMKVGKRPLTCALTMLAVVATLLIEPARLHAQVSVDVDNEFPNVGVVMVWLLDDGGQPLELLTMASGTLVHERVIVTAGHFTAPVRDLGGLPPGIGVFASFSPTDARDPSTWIPVIDQITHPSIPFCPPPDFCDPTTADVFEPLQPGIADVGLVVLEQAPPGIEPAKFAHPNTLSGPHAPGTPTTIVGYGFTAPAPGSGPPDPSTWDGKRRVRTSIFEHVVNLTWGIWGVPSHVCFGDSGGGIFVDLHPHPPKADERLVANVSDGGIDCLSANNNNRLDTASVQRWIRQTIHDALGAQGLEEER